MGFLDALRGLFGDGRAREADQRRRLATAWDIDEGLVDAEAPADVDDNTGAVVGATGYDQRMWSKKLRHLITEKLPVPEAEWRDFLADAAALGFDNAWVEREQEDAFLMLLRKIVADGVITGAEHHTIELARAQIGYSDARAEALLKRVVREAEALLGRPVQDG